MFEKVFKNNKIWRNLNVTINGFYSRNCNMILIREAIKQSVKRVQFSWKNYL